MTLPHASWPSKVDTGGNLVVMVNNLTTEDQFIKSLTVDVVNEETLAVALTKTYDLEGLVLTPV